MHSSKELTRIVRPVACSPPRTPHTPHTLQQESCTRGRTRQRRMQVRHQLRCSHVRRLARAPSMKNKVINLFSIPAGDWGDLLGQKASMCWLSRSSLLALLRSSPHRFCWPRPASPVRRGGLLLLAFLSPRLRHLCRRGRPSAAGSARRHTRDRTAERGTDQQQRRVRERGGERDSIAVSQRSHLTDASMLLHCEANTCAEQRAEGPNKKETVVCRRHEPRMMKTEPMTRHTCAHTRQMSPLEHCWNAQSALQRTQPVPAADFLSRSKSRRTGAEMGCLPSQPKTQPALWVQGWGGVSTSEAKNRHPV
jgi:hypothetical protein